MTTRQIKIRNRQLKHQISEGAVNVLAALCVLAVAYVIIVTLYVLI